MKRFSRRFFLKGVGAGSIALGCDAGSPAAGAADTSGAADSGGSDATGADSSGAADDAAAADTGDAVDEPDVVEAAPDITVEDVPAPPPPALAPLRGDGSHPFHYLEHLVILQMENRSFDHFFGSLTLDEGRPDTEGLLAGLTNPGSDGQLFPVYPLEKTWVFDPDPGHSHGASLGQWNTGKNDGFVREFEARGVGLADHRGAIMGYHRRAELPASYHLADHFALFDRWHAALLGPTWPNRFYSHCATSGGMWKNDQPLNAPTLYPVLADHGYSYGVYNATDLNFVMLIESLTFDQIHAKPIGSFFDDAKNGTLPNVTIVEPDFGMGDDHPPHDIRNGQAFIASIYEALRQSPKWDRTMFVIFYDEHGGFHDHVAPPKAGFDERAAEGFDQLGFRIPGLVAGGLVRRGQTIHELVDHSSIPGLIARVFDLPHLNKRSELAGDLGAALSLDLRVDAVRPVPPPMPVIDLFTDEIDRAAKRAFGQPELWDYAMRRGYIGRDYARALSRQRRALLDCYERLGTVRMRERG